MVLTQPGSARMGPDEMRLQATLVTFAQDLTPLSALWGPSAQLCCSESTADSSASVVSNSNHQEQWVSKSQISTTSHLKNIVKKTQPLELERPQAISRLRILTREVEVGAQTDICSSPAHQALCMAAKRRKQLSAR